MPEALVTPTLLRWARERRGMSREQLFKSTRYPPELLDAWEEDEARPTLAQAEKVASVLHVPLGYLFLDAPPELPLPIADLRIIDPNRREEMSLDCRQLLDDCLVKQDWYRDFLLGEDVAPLPFPGSYTVSSKADDIAADISSVLNLSQLAGTRSRASTWEAYRRELISRTEDAGVTVICTGVVGNNTRRTVSPEECRGFALPDPIAPLVFVNSRDYEVSKIFTLIHELAHIWIAQGGVSNVNPEELRDTKGLTAIERLCDQTAAEVLVPRAEIQSLWSRSEMLDAQIRDLSTYFRVSGIAVLRRAKDLSLITDDEFFEEVGVLQARTAARPPRKGGDFRNLFPLRSGRNLSDAVLVATVNGQLPINESARMLAVKPRTIRNAIERSGIR